MSSENRVWSRADFQTAGLLQYASVWDLRCFPLRRMGQIIAIPTGPDSIQVRWLGRTLGRPMLETVSQHVLKPTKFGYPDSSGAKICAIMERERQKQIQALVQHVLAPDPDYPDASAGPHAVGPKDT